MWLLLVFLISIYFLITRGIPRVLSWFIILRYKVQISIGRISLPTFSFEDVSIKKASLSIKIERIRATSSLFNQEERKLFAIKIYDVRIEKELDVYPHGLGSGSKCTNDCKDMTIENIFERASSGESFMQKNIDPALFRVPPSVISLAQFFGLHIISLHMMYLRCKWPECLWHASAEKIILEGSTVNDITIALNVNIIGAHIRALQQPDIREVCGHAKHKRPFNVEKSDGIRELIHSDPSLMECTVSCKVYIEVQSDSFAELESLSLQLTSPEVVLQERLFSYLEDKAMVATPVSQSKMLNKLNHLTPYQMLRKYWLFLPRKLRCKCDGFNIKFSNALGKITGKGSVASADLQTHFTRENALDNLPELLPDLSTEIQLDNIQMNGQYETYASITRITLQTQFIGDRINIKTEVYSLYGLLDYKDIELWRKYTVSAKKNIPLPPPKKSLPVCNPEKTFLNAILDPYCIGVIVEIWDISFQSTIPNYNEINESNSVSGIFLLQHSKQSMVLTQGMSQVAGEILVESFIANLGTISSEKSNVIPTASSKRCHTYGTATSIGLCIIEVSSVPSTTSSSLFPLKFEGLLDNVQLEWSRKLALFVSSFTRYIKTYMQSSTKRLCPERNESNKAKIYHSIVMKCSAVNIFCHSDYGVSVMMRVDDIHGEKAAAKSFLTFKGSKCVKFMLQGKNYKCLKSSELTDDFLSVKTIGVEEVNKEIHVNASIQLQMIWSTNVHMTLLTLVKDIKSFVKETFGNSEFNRNPDDPNEKSNLKLQFIAKGDLRIGAQLSEKHKMDFLAGQFIFLTADGLMSMKTDELKILFDDNEIFFMKGAQLLKLLNSAELKSERHSFETLTLQQNKAWKLVVDSWKLTFPYQYNFAEAFSENFLSVVKWIKLVHGRKRSAFTADSPLPSDLMIQVKEFAFEVCDDPFEVKLRYNYELMEDEYLESCKRVKALEKKIEETRKTNLQLLSGKINNLFKILQQKNSETYIKRSKKMYEKEPMRTQLFLWKMENLLIFAMADPSFHGTEKVTKKMQEIDFDSPWPEEGLEFSTLWCRMISTTCTSFKFNLRDYPQPLWDLTNMEVYGGLIGAEQEPTKRAKRSVVIDVGHPFHSDTVERSLTSLKFYHDLTWEAESFMMAYGPCWESAVSQFNIATGLISRPSLDPSLPLPWWDKIRLLFHGKLTLLVDQMTLLLHASLDPYNTTEEMELTWNEMTMEWTNANLTFTGDLNVLVRTASKYDDVRLMNLPNLNISVKWFWICKGNPNDHHGVMPCAPDKVPEYSSNQEHDSYRVFRSQNLKMNLGLETKSASGSTSVAPIEVIFYGSTLRWFENLKFIISGVARPTRRGILFNNTLPRKPQLSRHYQSVHLSLSFQRFEIKYWLSARVKKGFRFTGERLSLSSEHSLTLVPINDGLRHRPRTTWSIVFLNTELWEAQIWLISAMSTENKERKKEERKDSGNKKEDKKDVKKDSKVSITPELPQGAPQLEKFYFLNVTKVAYMRENLEPPFPTFSNIPDPILKDTPNHRLVVHNLKGVWTTSNRDIVFAVFDSWNKSQQLKRNLAPDIIKSFTPGSTTPLKPRPWSSSDAGMLSPASLLQVSAPVQNTPSPRTRLQSDHTSAMLQQLIAEADNNYIAYAEDCSNPEPKDLTLQGIKAACSTDDIIYKKWLIQLVNSQVLLKGSEAQGYVILSAAQSQICQRIHRPAWKNNTLVTKTTWTGSLECMQYYATVSEGDQEPEMADNIMWLTLDNIEEKDGTVINEVTDIVGSGQSVGGVVSNTVGISNVDNESVQLQRIVSRCRCEFFYVNYGETGLDPTLLEEVQPPPPEEGLWNNYVDAADTFTLMHYDLCASTNYLQYNMVLDILNNLLLYMDPKKKEFSEALARMRFKLQLYSREDQRKPIIQLQNQVRYHLSQLRFLEKEVYLIQRQMDRELTHALTLQRNDLESQASDCKEKVNSLGEELAMRIHCYNETQLSANHKLAASKGDKEKSLIRMNEVYFRKAQWKLTESDGQLGIAQLDLSNFLYSKKTYSDDTSEHLLELGFINVCNLLPNQIYKDVLAPAELKSSMPVDRQKTLRIYCREKPPCGGISILEHFEINVVPLKIELTYYFFKTMLKFCFPYNNTEENSDIDSKGDKMNPSLKRSQKVSSFYVDLKKDDVEIMKQRAEQNKHFVFIKIPELPVNLSYKGKKEKNIEDVHGYHLVIPTMEYHSVTWTWLDLLLAIKMSSKSALLSQAIKHKLNIMHRSDETSTPTEEDKARLLLGNKYMQHQNEAKGTKKRLFKFHK